MMMRFWTREVAGWLLIVLGLYLFYRCYSLLITDLQHHIVECGLVTIVGVFLFRGGIHLLKVAVAAEICMNAEKRLEAGRPVDGQRRPSNATMSRSSS